MSDRRARGARAALAGALALALAGIAAAALGPVYGGRVTVELAELPARFDPAPARGAGARLLSALVHERLVDMDGRDPRPSLAESWTAAAGGREWTLHLRAPSRFHDGSAIGSADVVRSLRRFLRSPSASAAGLAARIEGGTAFRNRTTERLSGLTTSDPLTVVLRLREPEAAILCYLAAADAAITSARGAGAGPFVPTTVSPMRGRAAFVPFPGHVRGRPFLDGVAVQTAGEASDTRADVSPVLGPGPLGASLLLVLDPAHPAFARADLRRAVAAAIDRGELVRDFLPGGATAVSPLPLALLPAVREARARSLRRTAAATAIVLAVSSEVPALVSQRVVAYLGAAGLEARPFAVGPDAAWTSRADARLLAWTPEVPHPLLALEELAVLVGWSGRGLLARAGRETDVDRRDVLLRAGEAGLRDRSLAIPLAALPLGHRARPGLHGIVVDAGGRIRLEGAWIEP